LNIDTPEHPLQALAQWRDLAMDHLMINDPFDAADAIEGGAALLPEVVQLGDEWLNTEQSSTDAEVRLSRYCCFNSAQT
jgi:hypothetical protein